jgi:hypothetical protein
MPPNVKVVSVRVAVVEEAVQWHSLKKENDLP